MEDQEITKPIRIEDLWGMVKTINYEPTYTPVKFVDQFRLYDDGTNRRFYCYDTTNQVWRYATLT